MSVRQKREVLDRLVQDFKEYNLPAGISYSAYITIVANPVMPRAVRKIFGNWSRAVKSVQISLRDSATKPELPPVKIEAPKIEMPKPKPVKIEIPKPAKPKAEPAKAEVEEDGKDI